MLADRSAISIANSETGHPFGSHLAGETGAGFHTDSARSRLRRPILVDHVLGGGRRYAASGPRPTSPGLFVVSSFMGRDERERP